MNTGAEFRESRKMLGWTIDETARRCPDVDIPKLSRFERGMVDLSEKQRTQLEQVLRDEIAVRSVKLKKLMKDWGAPRARVQPHDALLNGRIRGSAVAG